jgi:G3E family GTPase
MAQGKRVGVVTNDQGKYLVDTAFFTLADVPTVEVTGGCFCCNYDDLEARLEQLKHTAKPDVIFAESVGSCADIVATVVKPLLELRAGDIPPTSFSVFADARLLRRRLHNQPMPFSDDVVYIFDKQIEEAGLLVANKVDLLGKQEARDKKQELLELARERFPQHHIRLQNSLDEAHIAEWTTMLESGTLPLPEKSLSIDYQRYGTGEARLAWLDETLTLHVTENQGHDAIVYLIQEIISTIRQRRIGVGHLKFLVQTENQQAKLSFPTLDETGWEQHVPILPGTQVTVLINARVETSAEHLRTIVKDAIQQTTATTNIKLDESNIAFFHPGFPKPTHRI